MIFQIQALVKGFLKKVGGKVTRENFKFRYFVSNERMQNGKAVKFKSADELLIVFN
jgi:hypothetical protein